MNASRTRLTWLFLAAVAGLLLGSGVTQAVVAKAADGSIPCSAFMRNGHGGWLVLAPVMLDFSDRLYSPTVGTIFPPGSTANGIEMSDVLDRQCGNR
jgi:hypothetical protein